MRKSLLLLTGILSFVFASAQNDSITLKSGKVITGKYFANYTHFVEVLTGPLGDHVIIPKDSITAMKLSIMYKGNSQQPILVAVKDDKNLNGFVPPQSFKNYNTHLRTAGVAGVTGVLFSVVGSALSAIGAVTTTPALTYGGAGLAGVGGILNIVSIANLIPASKYKTPKLVEF